MTLLRRGQATLAGVSAVLLGGILALAWWSWRHRRGYESATRFQRTRFVLAGVGLAVIAVGTVGRLAVAVQPVSPCAPPSGTAAQKHGSPFAPSVLAQKVATWPETGIALLYTRAIGAHRCWSRSANYYVAVHANTVAGARAMNMGDIVMSPRFDIPVAEKRALAAHEARHRAQWAVGTVLGGPFAFPVAYAIDDFFFPGERNHFERQAGLETGGYRHSGSGPVLGPLQLATLAALPVVIVAALLVLRRRRKNVGPRGEPALVTTEVGGQPVRGEGADVP